MDTFELFIHIVQDDKQSSILLLLEVQNREEVSAEGEQSFVWTWTRDLHWITDILWSTSPSTRMPPNITKTFKSGYTWLLSIIDNSYAFWFSSAAQIFPVRAKTEN